MADDPRRQSPAAVAGCQACPARAECLAYAVAADQPDGVWGGLTRAERRAAGQTVAA